MQCSFEPFVAILMLPGTRRHSKCLTARPGTETVARMKTLHVVLLVSLAVGGCSAHSGASENLNPNFAVNLPGAIGASGDRISPVHAVATSHGVRATRSGTAGQLAVMMVALQSEGCHSVSFEDATLAATGKLMSWCTSKNYRIDSSVDRALVLEFPPRRFGWHTLSEGYQAWVHALAQEQLILVNTGSTVWITHKTVR